MTTNLKSTNAERVCTPVGGRREAGSGSSSLESSSAGDEVDLSSTDSASYDESEPIIAQRRVTNRQKFSDFSNVLKAFIGASLIGLPFAIKNSGIVLGVIGIVVIAVATDHCCHLIVKCKNVAISKACDKLREQGLDDYSVDVEKQFLGRTLSFGDVGKHAMGKAGTFAVNIAVFITQFGFCTGYFIFLGNTIRQLLTDFLHHAPIANFTTAAPVTAKLSEDVTALSATAATTLGSISTGLSNGSFLEIGAHHPAVFSPTALLNNSTGTFALLLLIPGPLLILISYINNIRKLGPVSVLANGAILTAFLATAVYIIAEFQSPHSTVKLFNWATFPVFFGQLTGAFEGIGTVIPIEGSMAENRRNYPCYLHISLTIVSVMLGSFGLLGYVRYGEGISQIVTDNLSGSWIVSMLRILLFLGILFTYPLQIYPVIQLSEKWLFHSRKSCLYQKPRRGSNTEASEPLVNGKPLASSVVKKKWQRFYQAILILSPFGFVFVLIYFGRSMALIECNNLRWLINSFGNGQAVPRWKRYILRTILVLITAAIGVVMRTQFAHITALTGAVGSSLLSYILPCIFHLKLRKGHLSYPIIVKDICLIIFGIVGGLVGVTVTIREIVLSLGKHPVHPVS